MNASQSSRTNLGDLDQALAQAAQQMELARQEHLFLQQEHERLQLRQRVARERDREQRDRERQREPVRATPPHLQRNAGQDTQPPTCTSSSCLERDHPVFLLNCKGCGAFLSDRGMKAILLLKPHVTLFSTDIIPATVGPLYPQQPFAERSLTRPPSSGEGFRERQVERTCDCLTETLGCYGCGAQVGYHIISPCERCTASVTSEKRGSNGHRTVLHCTEITARERRYLPGESGVRCAPTPCPFPKEAVRDRKPPSPLSRTREPVANTFHWNGGSAMGRGNIPQARYPRSGRRVRMVQIDRRSPRSTYRDNGLRQDEDDSDMSEYEDFLDLEFALEGVEPDGFEHEDLEQEKYDAVTGRSRALSAASHPRLQSQADHSQQRRSLTAGVNSKTSGSNGSVGRLIKRGEVVHWGDLVPGGERYEPFDSDLALQMPIALR